MRKLSNIRHKEIRIWALAGQETVWFFCARKEVEASSIRFICLSEFIVS